MGRNMADYTFDQAHYVPETGDAKTLTLANMTNWIGAAVSVGLVVSACVWGYRVMMRDVSGIPVVMAAEGPMRVQPENPGGELADHQGLAVNAVAGTSLAEAPAQRLVLAPTPSGLGEDDIALKDLPRDTPVPVEDVMPAAITDSLSLEEEGPHNSEATLIEAAVSAEDAEIDPIEALANELAANATAQPSPTAEEFEADLAAQDALLEDDLTQHSNSLARSLRPLARPQGARVQLASTEPLSAQMVANSAPQTASVGGEIDHGTLPAGTRLVQIGAFPSAEDARSEWARVSGFMGDFLADKQRVVMQAQSGGRTIYRLRVHGFEDLAEARRFCATSIEKNVDCIPVVTK